jgi:hypothetical protein
MANGIAGDLKLLKLDLTQNQEENTENIEKSETNVNKKEETPKSIVKNSMLRKDMKKNDTMVFQKYDH